MSDSTHPEFDRLTELLADRALFGLDDNEQRELDALQVDESEILSWESAAAAAQLATLDRVESLPPALAGKLLQQWEQTQTPNPPSGDLRVASQQEVLASARERVAWLVAAAALLLAVFLWSDRPLEQATLAQPTPTELRSELLTLGNAEPSELTQVAWGATDPEAPQAQGDVVWHRGRQQGVMRFTHLPPNDPSVEQYQLWIFDAERDDSYPIDGGVFNIPAGQQETLVEIDAKLPVAKALMFAITVEKPGGVVVSSRERLPLLAKVEAEL